MFGTEICFYGDKMVSREENKQPTRDEKSRNKTVFEEFCSIKLICLSKMKMIESRKGIGIDHVNMRK